MNEKLRTIEERVLDDLENNSLRLQVSPKGNSDYISYQFNKDVFETNKLEFLDTKKYIKVLKSIKQKYLNIYQEIENVVNNMEERVFKMAIDDYAMENDIEPGEVDRYDIDNETIEEFIREDWHFNIVPKHSWARDYFPDSKFFRLDHDPWGYFSYNHVEPILSEIEDTYDFYKKIYKKVLMNIKENKLNIFDYVFEKTDRLNWKVLERAK